MFPFAYNVFSVEEAIAVPFLKSTLNVDLWENFQGFCDFNEIPIYALGKFIHINGLIHGFLLA